MAVSKFISGDDLQTNLKAEENFYTLSHFIIKICNNVVRVYVDRNLLLGNSFEAFLNENIHVLYHLVYDGKCCKCDNDTVPIHGKTLSSKQFQLLFKLDGCVTKEHQIFVGRKCVQRCSCNYHANTNITLESVDLTLLYCMVRNLKSDRSSSLDVWINAIIDERNLICHASGMSIFNTKQFQHAWERLRGSTLGIAGLISSDYAAEIELEIEQLSQREFSPTYDNEGVVKLLQECRQEIDYAIEKIKERQAVEADLRRGNVSDADYAKQIDVLSTKINEISLRIHGATDLSTMFAYSRDKAGSNTVSFVMKFKVPPAWDMDNVVREVNKLLGVINQLLKSFNTAVRMVTHRTYEIILLIDANRRIFEDVDELRKAISSALQIMLPFLHVDMDLESKIDVFLTPFKANEFDDELTSDVHNSKAEHGEKVVDKREGHFEGKLNLKEKFEVQFESKFEVKCTFTIQDSVLVMSKSDKQLYLIHLPTNQKQRVQLDDFPRDITLVRTGSRSAMVAVLLPYLRKIQLYDAITLEKLQEINIKRDSVCINGSSQGQYDKFPLMIAYGSSYLEAITLGGFIIKRLKLPCKDLAEFVRFRDIIYFTDLQDHSVSCCNLTGALLWSFKNENLQDPLSLCVDRSGDVFVACAATNNVMIISPDGKHAKRILTGLLNPTSIDHENNMHHLLVYNARDGNIYLYENAYKTKVSSDDLYLWYHQRERKKYGSPPPYQTTFFPND